MIILDSLESRIVTQSEFPPCETLSVNMSAEGIKTNLMSNLCFLVSLMERSQQPSSPISSYNLNGIFGLAMGMTDEKFFDMTHVGKFRKEVGRAWSRARITLTMVFSILYERQFACEEIFPEDYQGPSHSKLDELMTELQITNSRMAHLCFLAELLQRCQFYPKHGIKSEELVDLIRACVFLRASTIDAVFISKFKNGHQLPWASARQLITRTMGIILQEPVQEVEVFPELELYRKWGEFWPLHIDGVQSEPSTPKRAIQRAKVRVRVKHDPSALQLSLF